MTIPDLVQALNGAVTDKGRSAIAQKLASLLQRPAELSKALTKPAEFLPPPTKPAKLKPQENLLTSAKPKRTSVDAGLDASTPAKAKRTKDLQTPAKTKAANVEVGLDSNTATNHTRANVLQTPAKTKPPSSVDAGLESRTRERVTRGTRVGESTKEHHISGWVVWNVPTATGVMYRIWEMPGGRKIRTRKQARKLGFPG